MKNNTTDIRKNLKNVLHRIAEAERQARREAGSVKLLAVSKTKPVEAIVEALESGQRAFGENYVDEAITKIQAIDRKEIQWHYIGAIQSRKCAAIARYFDWVHSVDRQKIAARLSSFRSSEQADLNICLQINLDAEEGKAGVASDEAESLAAACQLPGLRLRGLMAIPAPRTDFNEQRAAFARLRHCFESLQSRYPSMDTLSMGMSGDLEAAVAEGATIVRIGTAIFGAR